MGRGAWWARAHGVAKSQTQLTTHTHTFGSDTIVKTGYTVPIKWRPLHLALDLDVNKAACWGGEMDVKLGRTHILSA